MILFSRRLSFNIIERSRSALQPIAARTLHPDLSLAPAIATDLGEDLEERLVLQTQVLQGQIHGERHDFQFNDAASSIKGSRRG